LLLLLYVLLFCNIINVIILSYYVYLFILHRCIYLFILHICIHQNFWIINHWWVPFLCRIPGWLMLLAILILLVVAVCYVFRELPGHPGHPGHSGPQASCRSGTAAVEMRERWKKGTGCTGNWYKVGALSYELTWVDMSWPSTITIWLYRYIYVRYMSIVNSYSLWHVFLAWFRITFDDISTIDFTVLYSYRVEDTPWGYYPRILSIKRLRLSRWSLNQWIQKIDQYIMTSKTCEIRA